MICDLEVIVQSSVLKADHICRVFQLRDVSKLASIENTIQVQQVITCHLQYSSPSRKSLQPIANYHSQVSQLKMLVIRRLSRNAVRASRTSARWSSSEPIKKISVETEVGNNVEEEPYVLTPTQLHNQQMRKSDVSAVKKILAFTGFLVACGYYYLTYVFVDPDAEEDLEVE